MIVLHRLGHTLEPFHLNPDLIVTVEAHPDTVVTLATGAKVVVDETPERVADEVSAYRERILANALAVARQLRARSDERAPGGPPLDEVIGPLD